LNSRLNQKGCIFVSGLFEIKREKIDSRTTKQYFENLKQLLALIPNLILFHDDSITLTEIEQLKQIRPNIILIKQSTTALPLTKNQNKIDEFCRRYSLHSKDIVYSLPKYGTLVHSKFDFIQICHEMNPFSCHAIWVDVGVSRFVNHNLKNRLESKCLFESQDFNLAVEVDLHKGHSIFNFITGKPLLSIAKIGSSKRIIGASVIVVKTEYIQILIQEVRKLRDIWIKNYLWDTEQVFLRYLIVHLTKVRFHVQKINSPTSFFECILIDASKSLINVFLSNLISKGFKDSIKNFYRNF